MMKFIEEIDIGEIAILLVCAGIIYCLSLIIFKPFNYGWGVAWIGVIFGTFDLICLLYIYISNIIYRQKEMDKIEREKSWIDKALEKGI